MDTIQWYPGHMTRAKRMMQENLKLVDLIIEILDARVPLSSRNPDIDAMTNGKSRILVLGKQDLADPVKTAAFEAYFKAKGFEVMTLDLRDRKSAVKIRQKVESACRQKMERDKRRGIIGRPVRAMIAGIPNVGKSTLINSLAGRSSAKTGNKPGVTRGKQWISCRIGNLSFDLLDTPGILWPKFEDPRVGVNLALTGSVRDEILDPVDLSFQLLSLLIREYPAELNRRYAEEEEDLAAVCRKCLNNGMKETEAYEEVLKRISIKAGHIASGMEADLPRTAKLLVDDFRSGRIGRITLDEVPDSE